MSDSSLSKRSGTSTAVVSPSSTSGMKSPMVLVCFCSLEVNCVQVENVRSWTVDGYSSCYVLENIETLLPDLASYGNLWTVDFNKVALKPRNEFLRIADVEFDSYIVLDKLAVASCLFSTTFVGALTRSDWVFLAPLQVKRALFGTCDPTKTYK
jgi:hypothetical protein